MTTDLQTEPTRGGADVETDEQPATVSAPEHPRDSHEIVSRSEVAPVSATGTIRLLRDGAQAFPAWLAAIQSAKREVVLEMYWFGSDATGQRFADALAERARAGVAVYVLYDAIGSLGADPAMWQKIVAAGGHVMEFHPINPWRKRFRLHRITMRDHRKLLVVDNEVGFTGGINIGDPWASAAEGGGGWRDDAVEVRGEAVSELRALFFDNWLREGGVPPKGDTLLRRRGRRTLMTLALTQAGISKEPPPPRPRGLRARMMLASRKFAQDIMGSTPPPDPGATPRVQVIGHVAWGVRRTIRRMYLAHIRSARRQILIANSYFIPDLFISRALERAAKRGVEVRIMVPRDSDVPSVGYAGRALYAGLMKSGVHVHEWFEGMLHSKTAVIDAWATVGSYNLDYRSLRYNLEVNVASAEPGFVAEVERSFRADLVRCAEIDAEQWKHRPWYSKLLEWAHYLVRRFL